MALARFAREYRAIRRAEGWGSDDPAYYQALPFRDTTARFAEIWRIRARSYETFLEHVLHPLELTGKRLRVADLGAGNGWLAYRLACRGHAPIAVDLLDDSRDGLGALRRYTRGEVAAVRADFDELPFQSNWLDLVIFNASLHYATDYARTLRESLRVLQAGGTLVILDSPMYTDPRSGARMVREREARFTRTHGFASNALPSEHYLTPERLERLARELGLVLAIHNPHLAWPVSIRRRLNGLRARRQPARFPVIVGRVK
jgi:SAM-dependent methyltransferase